MSPFEEMDVPIVGDLAGMAQEPRYDLHLHAPSVQAQGEGVPECMQAAMLNAHRITGHSGQQVPVTNVFSGLGGEHEGAL